MPAEYAQSVLDEKQLSVSPRLEDDANRIATIKHYRSLIPLAQTARKPIFGPING